SVGSVGDSYDNAAAVLRQQLANGSGIVTRRRISHGNLADRIAEIRERLPGIGRIESMLQLVPQNEDKLSRCRQLPPGVVVSLANGRRMAWF
ncbi:hypothetical protein, partial [Xanthomonas graminis]|uniref:hypothetical protein n=1 Tax=Xanthomonas graminis TaxID=3390026 RepID=UPI001BAF7A6C